MLRLPTTRGERFRPGSASRPRLLVVDDEEALRARYATLLQDVDGVASVVSVGDGAEALQIANAMQVDIAVLDLNMPRLDGVEAAVRLAALESPPSIALHSSDPEALRERARGLEFALFDKLDLDGLLCWVASEVERRLLVEHGALARDLSCSRCGYGVATDRPPRRCPMCHSATSWRRKGSARRAPH